jgi:hypothetical protein
MDGSSAAHRNATDLAETMIGMNERGSGGRLRRWAATLSLAGVAITGVAGIGAYEIVHATSSATSPSDSGASSGLGAGSGSSMTTSGGS